MLFIDLSSYTPLTEAMGDAAAATVVSRFSDIVRTVAIAHDGQIVKQIGDEFMLAFPTAVTAVSFGVSARTRTQAEPHFPGVRIGCHCGSVLYREGDYYGSTVNLAARVTSAAGRDQFLVTDAVREQIADAGWEVHRAGTRSLKGIAGEVELFDVEPSHRTDRPIDPVCGMALDVVGGTTFAFDHEDREILFCSEHCRDQFIAAPGRYATTR
jgi:class 3 adenylate cyclase